MRSALIAVCAGCAVGATFVLPGAAAAKPTPRCGANEVSRTVVYVRRKGARPRRVTGCAPRSAPVSGGSVPAALAGMRKFALTLAPPSVKRALRSRAARRVLAADGATDAALAKRGDIVAAASAVSAGHANETPVDGPPGTKSIVFGDGNNLDTQFDVGREWDSTLETTSNRLAGVSVKKSKTQKVKYVMNRCPDATGIAHGTLSVSIRETTTIDQPGSRVVLVELSTYEGKIAVQFGDDARIASVDLSGDWLFSSQTGRTNRTVRGTTSAAGFHQSPTPGSNPGQAFDNFVDINPTTTTATDDGIAVAGRAAGLYALLIPDLILTQEILNPLQIRVLGGACVKIVPDVNPVHVKAGGVVAIVAHLEDIHGTKFAGTITEYDPDGRVAPTSAQASLDATFTYQGASPAPPGGTDVVQLSHTSRHGRALSSSGTVNVIYDRSPFPNRFDGTWTRTFTPKGDQQPTETIQGSAAFVRNPAVGAAAEGLTQIPYTLVSSSVEWSMTGTFFSGSCKLEYSGAGTDQGDLDGGSGLLLEDVSNKPTNPKPEPSPFYYFIKVVDHTNTPTYTDTYSGPDPCPNSTYDGNHISGDYVIVGEEGSFDSAPPPDNIQKTADPTQLQGHRVQSDDQQTIDDTWSFTGSY